MLCKKMVESKGTVHPCGQCLFCRINFKRDWLSRMLLEAACHESNQFLTLTYDDPSLPDTVGEGPIDYDAITSDNLSVVKQAGSLFPPDLTLFFKKVRKFLGNNPEFGTLRYFAVGEYGELRGRPHYHVLAFGLSMLPHDLARIWSRGKVHIGEIEHASIEYCIAYAIKYREKNKLLVEVRRHPEFTVSSTNPGLGALAIGELRESIFRTPPLPDGNYLIPDSFRLMGKEYPIPRYIRRALEDEGFISARDASQVAQSLHDSETLQAVLTRSKTAARLFEDLKNPTSLETREQKVRNAESRQRIKGKKNETL